MSERGTDVAMKQRRATVASYLLAGMRSVRGIARKMGVSPATISRDLKVIEAEWADEVDPTERERHRVTELKKLDQMESAITLASLGYEEGRKPKDQTRDVDKALDAQKGRIKLMERRARLLGLDTTNLNLRNVTPQDILRAMIEGAAGEVPENEED